MSNEARSTDDVPEMTEVNEQSDEAFDDSQGLDPGFLEAVEVDPSLDPSRQIDVTELEEIGAEFDDPEAMASLSGSADDPDGIGGPPQRERDADADPEGWDLDAALTGPSSERSGDDPEEFNAG